MDGRDPDAKDSSHHCIIELSKRSLRRLQTDYSEETLPELFDLFGAQK